MVVLGEKISQMQSLSTLDGTENVPVQKGGNNYKAPMSLIMGSVSLSIKKTYSSVSAMNSDNSPVGNDGQPLNAGDIVSIYNPSDAEDPDNNSIYTYMKPGWAQSGKLSQVDSELSETSVNPVENRVVTENIKKEQRLLFDGELTLSDDVTDYSGCFAELYVGAVFSEGYTLGVKFYRPTTPNLYLRPYKTIGGSYEYAWQCMADISSWENGVVYELKCTTEGTSDVNVGDTVGYVVFKDIDKFKASPNSGGGIPLYYPYVANLANFPQISNRVRGISAEDIKGALPEEKISDNAVTANKISSGAVTTDKILDKNVTTGKIADGAVTTGKIADRAIFEDTGTNNRYADNVFELWLDPKYRDTETEGIAYRFKIYRGKVYARPYIGESLTYVWNSIATLPDKDTYRNTPIELVCDRTGGGVTYGDIVGYVVFGNTDNWDASDGDIGQILSTNVWDIGRFPIISLYLQNQALMSEIARLEDEIENISPDVETMETGIEVVLPDEVVITAGDRLELFHRSCIRCVNPYNYHIVALCDVGQNYPRYYCFNTSQSHVGNTYQLTLQVKRNDGSIIASGQTQIKVIAAMAQPSSNKNILCVGASATAGGQWAGEVKRRLTETSGDGTPYNPKGIGLSNITFVGRKTGTTNPVNLEATGGWTWSAFSGQGRPAYRFQVSGVSQLNMSDTYSVNGVTLTITEINVTEGSGNIRCTYSGGNEVPASGTLTRVTGTGDESITYSSVESESFNPFWNNGKLDFKNYANLYCNGSIDLLITHLGVNDIFGDTAAETLIESYVKPFVRAFHTDFPNSKFIISSLPLPDCTGGMAANYGASEHNYYNRAQYFWDYAKAFDELAKDGEFSSYLSTAKVLQEFDCEYSYPKTEAAVNNRNTTKVQVGTNGVHPYIPGYNLVADAIYRTINNNML